MTFCAENKVLKGYELLRELLENGLHPDNVVFNALIRGLCKERQYVRVSEMLHIMPSNAILISLLIKKS